MLVSTMEMRFLSATKALASFLHLAVCIVSLAMLLLVPATRVHNFGTHFRSPEVRRTVQRHISIAHGDSNAPERIGAGAPLPAFFTPTETFSKTVALDRFELHDEVPLVRLLNRLKLNPSGSSGQDPLLQA
jgi:hypothetical protein